VVKSRLFLIWPGLDIHRVQQVANINSPPLKEDASLPLHKDGVVGRPKMNMMGAGEKGGGGALRPTSMSELLEYRLVGTSGSKYLVTVRALCEGDNFLLEHYIKV